METENIYLDHDGVKMKIASQIDFLLRKYDKWYVTEDEYLSLPHHVLLYCIRKGLIPPSIRKEIIHGK